MPDSLKVIGKDAFRGCSAFRTHSLPENLIEIESAAFAHTAISSIHLPENLQSIGESCFMYCKNLTSITLPSSINSIERYMFEGCSSIRTFNIPDNITTIGDGAFADCSSLETITLPRSIQTIGNMAFSNCTALTHITLPPNLELISKKMFYNCTALNNVQMGNVTRIDSEAFGGCTALETIKLPTTLTTIGDLAFQLSGISNIELPTSLTHIGHGSFTYCYNLTEITIPSSVSYIGQLPFGMCTEILSINVDKSNPYFSSYDGALYDKNLTTLLEGPHGREYVDFAPTTQTITFLAFGLSKIKKVELPPSVTELQQGAFHMCDSIQSITLPRNLSHIPLLAFTGIKRTVFEVYCHNPTPPTTNNYNIDNIFVIDIIRQDASIYVPRGSGDLYRESNFWSQYNIIEMEGLSDPTLPTDSESRIYISSGSLHIDGYTPDTPVNVYSSTGVLIHRTSVAQATEIKLPHGIYIVQVGNTTHKIAI